MSTPSLCRPFRLGLIFILSLLLAAGGAFAQKADDEIPAKLNQPLTELAGDGPWVVRIAYHSSEQVRSLAEWADVWEVDTEAGQVIIQVERADFDRLTAEGFKVWLDERHTAQLARLGIPLKGQFTGIPGFPCYRTVEETFAQAQEWVINYPNLATWTDVGDSWEKTQDPQAGWDIYVLKLTQSAIPGPKPIFFANCSIHAREYTTAPLCMNFAEMLIEGYGVDADATWILDHHEVHLMPITNPDGRKMAETGLSWRKNTDNDFCSNTNSRGVDLNRNFDFQWGCCGGSSGSECSTTFRGPSPASEPELQTLEAYLQSIFPDQRPDDLTTPAAADATGVAIDIHASGELVLWSWGFTSDTAPNGIALQTLGRKLAFYNGHTPQKGIELYVTDGTSKDFYYGTLGVAGLVYELGTQFFESCSYFENSILPGNLPSLLYAAKVARTPYLTPAGPETYGMAVPSQPSAPGDLVTVTATVDDSRYNNSNGTEPSQNIASAEVYVGLAPWETGASALPMAASDGTFDATSEGVEATIDTSGLAPGRHILYVRGSDVAGNVGAVSAVFLDLIDPASAPVIQGTVRSAGTLAPLPATLTIGGFTTASDPGTGFYSLQVPAGTYDVTADAAGHLPETVTGVIANDFDTVTQNFDLIDLATCDSVDFEGGAAGWTNSPASTCSTGTFVVGTPTEIVNGGVTTQLGGDHTTGSGNAFFSAVNTGAGTDDIDGGECIVTSPIYPITQDSSVSIWYFHGQRDAGDDAGDFFFLEMSTDGGANWSVLQSYGDETVNAVWTEATAAVTAGDDVQFRVRAADGTGGGDLVEAGVDDLLICPTAPACTVDADCDDGLYCNGAETCNAGSCQSGTAPACDDGAFCNGAETCNEATDSCDPGAPPACDDGLYCNGTETCNEAADACDPGTAVECDDGLFCNGTDTCNEATDSCDPGTPPACDDGAFCNGIESCNEATDSCDPGTPVVCDDGLFCNGTDTCNEATDSCDVGAPPACDDGAFCNGVETCNEATDSCDPGTPVVCDDGAFCNGTDTCNEATDSCDAGTAPDCDDGVSCTDDACNEGTDSCDNVANDGLCPDDGAFCNGTEFCDAVLDCQSTGDPCGAGETCNESTDVCEGGGAPVLYMSFRANTSVPGVGTVTDEDVVSYDTGSGTWALEFDGSDVGLSSFEIDGLAILPGGDLLLSFRQAGTVGGVSADDSDVVRFTGTGGANTSGTFSLYFDGSSFGLTSNGEDVDALTLDANGDLVVSTQGSFSGTGASGADEDLFLFSGGSFSLLFDGSDVGQGGNSAADTDAATFTSGGSLLLSILGSATLSGVAVDDEDVVELTGSFGSSTSGTHSMYLDLSAVGIDASEDVGSLHIID